jgi:hypothetical protein
LQNPNINRLIQLVEQPNERNHADQHELMGHHQTEVSPELKQAFNEAVAAYNEQTLPNEDNAADSSDLIYSPLSFFTGSNLGSSQPNNSCRMR